MEKLKSHASEVIARMEESGKVKSISFRKSSELDHKLALQFKKVKADFELKERKSRALVQKIELKSRND